MGKYNIWPSEELAASSPPPKATNMAKTAQIARRFAQNARFWGIMIALCTTNLLCALEATVLITSLPTVIKDLDMGGNYIWVNNVFYLSRYVIDYMVRLLCLIDVGTVPWSAPSAHKLQICLVGDG